MAKPEILPINRVEDLHTNRIGTYSNGKFMIIESSPVNLVQDGNEVVKLCLVKYTFKKSGELDGVEYVALPVDASESQIESERKRFLSELKQHEFCSISVKPFELLIDGLTFGLVYSDVDDCITLQPGSLIMFQEPWDGEYYT